MVAEKKYGYVNCSLLKMEMREEENKASFIFQKQPQVIVVLVFLRKGQMSYMIVNWGCGYVC